MDKNMAIKFLPVKKNGSWLGNILKEVIFERGL